jgi:hypothetical protein
MARLDVASLVPHRSTAPVAVRGVVGVAIGRGRVFPFLFFCCRTDTAKKARDKNEKYDDVVGSDVVMGVGCCCLLFRALSVSVPAFVDDFVLFSFIGNSAIGQTQRANHKWYLFVFWYWSLENQTKSQTDAPPGASAVVAHLGMCCGGRLA